MTLVLAELAAGTGLLAAFGVHVTDAQIFAITQFAEVSVAVGLFIRSKVTPSSKIPPAGTPQSA
jgi:hypothetical protein